MKPDALALAVLETRLSGIVREMQQGLFRTGYSTAVRESQDASCALLDPAGDLVAQHVVLPLHTGAFPACARALLGAYDAGAMRPEDAFVVNDPYLGGSPHAPDFCVLVPACFEGRLLAFCASMAHKPDIGGAVPGSCPGDARDIFQEGTRLPAVRLTPEVERILANNSRDPETLLGDLRGQVGCCRLGAGRLTELAGAGEDADLARAFAALQAMTARRVALAVAAWPDGSYTGESTLDHDGIDLDRPVHVRVRIDKRGDRLVCDFSQSSDQTRGPVNIRPPLVRACCHYCLLALIDPELPVNAGLDRILEVRCRPGSILDPRHPAPLNLYINTAQAVVESLFAALGEVLPDACIGAGCGSGSLILGSSRGVQYEIFGGGAGAGAGRDGLSGITVHVSNSRIAPVEVIESEFPVRIERFEPIADSGGAGQWRGGLGFLRAYRVLQPGRLVVRTDRYAVPPPGRRGGLPGRPGRLTVCPGTDRERRLPSRFGVVSLEPGDTFRIERPGGGGVGDPRRRERAAVREDVRQGRVTPAAAREIYGLKGG